MPILMVTDSPEDWPFDSQNVQVVDPETYLINPAYNELRGIKLFNLCRSYRYQSLGYYVSLLAEARGHRPLPSITTIQDMKSTSMVRLVSDDLDELIQASLSRIRSNRFTLSIYFGRNMAKRYDRLSLQLFNQFRSPFLRALFVREKNKWHLRRVATISASDIPPSHMPFVREAATQYMEGRLRTARRRPQPRYWLAILRDPLDPEPPSDEKALRKFVKAAESVGIGTELIDRNGLGRLGEFDALFIRDTTRVNHYTYRFSRRASSEGLVVIDDPQSIVRCTNKVYMTELLNRHKIATPRTMIVHRHNVADISQTLGLPVVLKLPDSSFSAGVVKVESEDELTVRLEQFFAESEMIVAQEFVPTTFDWRIGILDRHPLYAAKYYMAPRHWQIIRQDRPGRGRYGRMETLPVELAPKPAVRLALKAANLIGDGLYGVDVKQSDGAFYVIEVNDNPTLEAGCEDAILKDDLYRRIMEVFLRRIEKTKGFGHRP